MPDWTKSMEQTFAYYSVDPVTWHNQTRLNFIKSCTIKRDSESETLGSASFTLDENIGEMYIRVYLITIQNGITEEFPLGTFLVQTPNESFNGYVMSTSADAYTPLIELKEKMPPIGYSILKGTPIMQNVYDMVSDNVRAPVIHPAVETDKILTENYTADSDVTWLDYIKKLISKSDNYFVLDEMGEILFDKKTSIYEKNPIYTFDDGSKSILYTNISVDKDLYGIPNVAEIVYSTDSKSLYSRIENNDPSSIISTKGRGREILYRDTDPQISRSPDQSYLDAYARKVLEDLSTLKYQVSYTHGYAPVSLGDCVRLKCSALNINSVNAVIISQNIKCEPGCPVEEVSVFTNKLWEA